MVRAGVTVVVIVVCAAVAATFDVTPARADFVEPPLTQQPYYTAPDSTLYAAVRDATTMTDMTSFEATFTGEGAAATAEALPLAEAGQIVPAMGVSLGSVALGAAAGYVGWKIGSGIYTKFLAPAKPTGALFSAVSVGWAKTGGAAPYAVYAPYACSNPAAGCETLIETGSDTGGSPIWTTNQEARFPSAGMTDTPPSPLIALMKAAADANAVTGLTVINAKNGKTNTDYFGGHCATNCSQLLRVYSTDSDTALMHAWGLTPVTAAVYNALTTKIPTSYTEPTHTPDDAAAIRSQLASGPHQARDLVNWIIDHDYGNGQSGGDFTPFVLPQPIAGETYAAYLDRLRARGWLGTATVVDEDDFPYPDGSPAAALEGASMTGVQVGTGVDIDLWDGVTGDPAPWPDNPPHIEHPGDPVRIRKTPADGSGFGDDGGPPSIDFGPISDIDWGCRFPYGLLCYAQDVTRWFDVTPAAPVFDFNIPCPDLAPCDTYEFGPVDLGILDTYMSWIRTLISVVLWIGAVYYVAAKLVGFNAAGHPGEAMHDEPHEHFH